MKQAKRMLRVSVKQLNLFGCRQRPSIGGCPRAWGFHYLDGLRLGFLPPHLVDGIKFHAVCASLVSTNRMPVPQALQPGVVLTPQDCEPEGHFGRMARAAIMLLPIRACGEWIVEHVGLIPWATARGTECEIDLRPDLASAPLGAPLMNYLVDFKGTSDKRRALKSLEHDVQANVYAHGLHMLGASSTLARWIYVNKKTYASWPVERMFHPDKTEAWLHENIDNTIDLIHTFRDAGTDAMSLPGDEQACGGTGRFCDHGEARCLGPVGARPGLIPLSDILRFKGTET